MIRENIARAAELSRELTDTETNIKILEDLIISKPDTSIDISKNDDHSGWYLETVYYAGNYSVELHTDLLTGILAAYKQHLQRLTSELEEL